MMDYQPDLDPPDTPARIGWRSSYWLVVLLALSIGIFSVLLSLAVDWAMHGMLRRVFASDLMEGAVAAILSAVALSRMQARRRELLIRMQIVEDVNHHVRNALTSIVLSASLHEDEDLNGRVKDACDRIDWVLSEVLSQSVGATDFITRRQSWNPGLRLRPPNPASNSPQTKIMRN